MKIILLLFLVFVAAPFQHSSGQASNIPADSMMRYYSKLAASTDESDKARLETILYQLLKSSKESDWLTARRFFYQLKKNYTADSIAKAAKLEFPLGQLVRDEKVDTVFKEKDAVKKESLYQEWIKQFPPEKFGNDRIIYDYARNSISTSYAEAGNVKKAILYANMVETPAWKGEGWAGAAYVLARKGFNKEAIELLKKAAANSYKYMTTERKAPGAAFAATGYIGYTSSLAELLLKEKQYEEALRYIREAHDSSKSVRANVNATYSKILLQLKKDKEAFAIIDEAVKAGQATADMKENLKQLYPKVKGTTEGYDEYMVSLAKILAANIRKELSRQIIKQPAPLFELKDLDGKTVSLQDLKGKTVILDFWATWCGPCKRSFPAMKLAMEKFKDDPNVRFLFIHTWEQEEKPELSAKKYIVDNKYPFEVLMDLKNADGINKVVEDYKVSAIPTKFVIDKNGNIRFKFTGAGSGDDAVVEEIAAMIELVNK